MAPKRKAEGTRGGKKAKKPDWRMPLFYWRGQWSKGTWQGSWVASEDGLPSDADFQESTSTFKLSAEKGELAGKLAGSYKLDNGDGPADYSDIEHIVHATPVTSKAGTPLVVVGARGDTEFGKFLSMGVLVGTTLTLARRYIDDKDPRNKLSATAVVEEHCPAIGNLTPTSCEYEPNDFLKRLHDELLLWKFDGALARPLRVHHSWLRKDDPPSPEVAPAGHARARRPRYC